MPEQTTAWLCVHCRKLYKQRAKHHCVKHEKYCKMNPDNDHACFRFCEHLHSFMEDETGWDGEIESSVRCFKCNITGKLMHSYIAERINHPASRETDRMPLECEHFEPSSEFVDFEL